MKVGKSENLRNQLKPIIFNFQFPSLTTTRQRYILRFAYSELIGNRRLRYVTSIFEISSFWFDRREDIIQE